MSKTTFGQGTIVTPAIANAWQNPEFVSREDYPIGTSQLDLNNGQIFIPQIDPEKDLVTSSEDINKFLATNGTGGLILQGIWQGEVEIPNAGTLGSIGIPVVVQEGSILNTLGESRTWTQTTVEVPFNTTQYIYADNDGVLTLDTELPPRVVPHTPIAELTASNNAITNFVDLRPHTFVGAHNDTPLDLVNTATITVNYQASSYDRIICDSSGGSFTITMPENPRDGDKVALVDLTGSFNQNPVILAPFRNGGTSAYTISDSTDDWLFNANYTFVQLVYIADSNTWAFEAIPDTTCKNRGVFVRCGGFITGLVTQTACEAKGYEWVSATNQCKRFNNTGVYADGDGGFIEIPDDDRCELNQINNKGRFLECQGTTAVYIDGSGDTLLTSNTYKEENAERCGGRERGRFVKCFLNTTINEYSAQYEDGNGGLYNVDLDHRCSTHSFGRFQKCLAPGVANFGDQTVPVGIYEDEDSGQSYLFDDPRCRDITPTDTGRFLKCDGTTGVYQSSNDGSSYRTNRYDPRCYQSDRSADIKMSMRKVNHGPWLLCDDSTYNKADYPSLYDALIGITHDGTASTFRVPNMVNRSPYGASGNGQLGDLEGSATHILTVAQMPVHDHSATASQHTHSFTGTSHNHGVTVGNHSHTYDASHSHTVNLGNHTHGFNPTAHTHTGTASHHTHALDIPGHAHTHGLLQHAHGQDGHTHVGGAHSHEIRAWYSFNNDADHVESFNRPPGQTSAVGAEATTDLGAIQYRFTNSNNEPIVANGGVVSTTGPDRAYTGTVVFEDNQGNTFGQGSGTGLAGAYQAPTGGTTPTLNVDSATAGGTISNQSIGGTTANVTLANSTNTVAVPVTLTSATAGGTISGSASSIVVGTKGLGQAHSILHPVIRVNYFIHL